MMGLIPLFLAACFAWASATSVHRCETFGAKDFIPFGKTPVPLKLRCGYSALRNTICGNYSITINLSSNLTDSGTYIPENVWISVKDNRTGKAFGGRTTYNIANKWLQDYDTKGESLPITQKTGELGFYDVFRSPFYSCGKKFIVIYSEDASFVFRYYLYDPNIKKSLGLSGFVFDCLSDTFKPTAYPVQLCGDGTADEVKLYKDQENYDDYQATLLYNIFMHKNQNEDEDCEESARILQKECAGNEYEAVKSCHPIFTNRNTIKCIRKAGMDTREAFRNCLEVHCKNRRKEAMCDMVGKCRRLKKVVKKVVAC